MSEFQNRTYILCLLSVEFNERVQLRYEICFQAPPRVYENGAHILEFYLLQLPTIHVMLSIEVTEYVMKIHNFAIVFSFFSKRVF